MAPRKRSTSQGSTPQRDLDHVAADPSALRSRLLEIADDLPFEVTVRPMMGGFIGYADGRPFVSLSTGGFGVKLGLTHRTDLLMRPGARRMRHAPDQPASKTYIAVSDDDIADDEVLIHWLTLSADTAPATPPKRR